MSAYRDNQAAISYRKVHVVDTPNEQGIIRTLVLSNPARRNAIGPEMVNELLHALNEAATAPPVRVVVITGDGEAFCAGGDFSQMTGGEGNAPTIPHQGDYADLLQRLYMFEKPTIARVRGAAMGGGLGIVAACTFAVADEEATFGTPEVKVGLFPMMIMAVLQRVVPKRKLMHMMLLGDRLSAQQALEYGLVGQVSAKEMLDVDVSTLARRLASLSPSTLRLGLRAFAMQSDARIDEALPMLRDKLAEVLATDDAREGLMAFLEKRTPVWTGK
ncbi:MAG: enoyl-CoA hydratase-related protein [Polyangiaceae bacterium]